LTSGSPRVLQITESLNVTYGGQAIACARLAEHLAAAGAAVSLATIDGGLDDARVRLDSRVESIRCVPTGPANVTEPRTPSASA